MRRYNEDTGCLRGVVERNSPGKYRVLGLGWGVRGMEMGRPRLMASIIHSLITRRGRTAGLHYLPLQRLCAAAPLKPQRSTYIEGQSIEDNREHL